MIAQLAHRMTRKKGHTYHTIPLRAERNRPEYDTWLSVKELGNVADLMVEYDEAFPPHTDVATDGRREKAAS